MSALVRPERNTKRRSLLDDAERETIANYYRRLEAECKRRFAAVFNGAFTAEIGARWLTEAKRLHMEYEDGRSALRALSARKAEQALRKHGIDPFVRSTEEFTYGDFIGHSPILLHIAEAYAWETDSVGRKHVVSRRPAPAMFELKKKVPVITDIRSFVLSKFEVGHEPAPEQVRFAFGPQRKAFARRLTDSELAVLSLLLRPYQQRKVIEANCLPTHIIEQERKAMYQARKHYACLFVAQENLPTKGGGRLQIPL